MLNMWLKILVYHGFALANYSAFTFMAKLASFELKFCVFKDLITAFYEKERTHLVYVLKQTCLHMLEIHQNFI